MDYLHHNASMNRLCITKLDVTYRKAIAHRLLCIISYRLVYLEFITLSINHICRIIDASPTAGRMREYKTLYQLKIRLFWPRMKTVIKDWVKQCPHYMKTYRWRRRSQEFMFSWPVSSPFAILHVHLWIPGHFTDCNSNVSLMNVMCDMTQFVIIVLVPNEIAATLAKNFMQRVF